MFDILFIVCLIVVGYQLGKTITVLRIQNDIVKNFLKESDTEEPNQVHKLRIETIDSILYLYDDENTFICQATTIDELARLSQQHNNIDYAAVIHNDKIFTFVNGVSSEK
jgi:sulfur relay (sulfurtransferase) DsrF/TusC family protein